MPNIIRKYDPSWRSLTHQIQFINFVMGIVLVVLSLFSMFLQDSINPEYSMNVDTFFLAIAGILSIWAGFSHQNKTAYYINLGLGMFFILTSVIIGIFQFYGMVWLLDVMFKMTTGDIVSHGIIGLTFYSNAFYWKRIQAWGREGYEN